MLAVKLPSTTDDWPKLLSEGLVGLGESASPATMEAFECYASLLRKWSSAYNLTKITEPFEVVRQHFLDSASVLPHLQGPNILDVGTGAGFPGLVVALLRPAWQVTVLDSVAKKTRFCTQVAHDLGLANVRILNGRVESTDFDRAFHSIVSRAFASLERFAELTSRHLAPGGRLVAMKGKLSNAELDAVEAMSPTAVPLHVPGLVVTRHAVLMQPVVSEL